MRAFYDTVVEKPGVMWTCGNLTAYIAGSTLVAMEDPGMAGPGIYRPDPSEGITRPEDLPPPQILYVCVQVVKT